MFLNLQRLFRRGALGLIVLRLKDLGLFINIYQPGGLLFLWVRLVSACAVCFLFSTVVRLIVGTLKLFVHPLYVLLQPYFPLSRGATTHSAVQCCMRRTETTHALYCS